jgi:recombination protein RecR
MKYPDAIEKLIESLRKYPGVGKKTAERYALFTVNRMSHESIDEIIGSYQKIKEDIFQCPICGNITDTNPCYICKDESRTQSTIIVVEEAKDIISMEKNQ